VWSPAASRLDALQQAGQELSSRRLAVAVVAVERFRRAHAGTPPASLDAPIGDDESNNFSEVVEDENAETPYEQLEDKTVTKMLREMVTTLDPREATILSSRFGLDGGPEKTLEEVGVKFGVTRERVRQIQSEALEKLRARLKVRGLDRDALL